MMYLAQAMVKRTFLGSNALSLLSVVDGDGGKEVLSSEEAYMFF